MTKRSSNTTREDRSRLKVNGTVLDCNYAHGIRPRSFHRRIYQMQGSTLVLVHYLDDGLGLHHQLLHQSAATVSEGNNDELSAG